MLSSIHIESFRGFRSLTLDRLRWVNLIVGKNNSGKTSLIEAISILLNPEQASKQLLELRPLESQLQHAFGQAHFADWLLYDGADPARVELTGLWNGSKAAVALVPESSPSDGTRLTVERKQKRSPRTLHHGAGEEQPTQSEPQTLSINCCIVGTERKTSDALIASFGKAIVLRDGEEAIESQLKSVDSRIRKVRIIPIRQGYNQLVVDIGLKRLIPLSQVGQGIYRLVEIYSELIGSEAQVCVIDEVETGVHHSCLANVWKGIAGAAQDFKVQVFATTHSHECLLAAHEAFAARPEYDFSVIQLFRETDAVQGRVLDRSHIEAAIAGEIDLRG
jgi:energy-coupling factor transporter ATP-binding protein EcfA2